ncbi:hypothetical protein GCM10027572_21090 [Flexivirga lutea]
MSNLVSVTGTLSNPGSDAPPGICYVLPEPLDDRGHIKEIAKLSRPDGSWSLLLGVNADYEITVRSCDDDRRELGTRCLHVGTEHIRGVSIVLNRSSYSA